MRLVRLWITVQVGFAYTPVDQDFDFLKIELTVELQFGGARFSLETLLEFFAD
jgi:hypothetical protein